MSATPTTEFAAARAFNDAHPIGTPVRYWKGVREGAGKVSTTRTVAQLLGGHTAVVWLNGVSGCIALTHIQPVDVAELDAAIEAAEATAAVVTVELPAGAPAPTTPTAGLDLVAIRKLADAAPSGPWEARRWQIYSTTDGRCVAEVMGDAGQLTPAFFAAARTDVLAMADEIDRLRAQIDVLRRAERHQGRAALTEYRDANHRHNHRAPGWCICGDDWDDEGCTEYVGLTEAAQLYTGETAEVTR